MDRNAPPPPSSAPGLGASPADEQGTWLNDIQAAEHAVVGLVRAASEALDLLANTPVPAAADRDSPEDLEAAMNHAFAINAATDAYLGSMNAIQRNLRKAFRLLSTEGIVSPLPPFRADIYSEERLLALSTQAVDLALARVQGALDHLDEHDPSPTPSKP
ncbi:hypothetical protein H9P43_008460 [Blastocladiella emersonii ATCC 22665]|nr:hypothetical protein H9P43_008460 [Blastocladiella emersonii ATCC 22665]